MKIKLGMFSITLRIRTYSHVSTNYQTFKTKCTYIRKCRSDFFSTQSRGKELDQFQKMVEQKFTRLASRIVTCYWWVHPKWDPQSQ